MIEEKNKVGRPKLADSDTKKKALITISIALLLSVTIGLIGTYVLFGFGNQKKLEGAAVMSTQYCSSKGAVVSKDVAVQWKCNGNIINKSSCTGYSNKVPYTGALIYAQPCGQIGYFGYSLEKIGGKYYCVTKTTIKGTPVKYQKQYSCTKGAYTKPSNQAGGTCSWICEKQPTTAATQYNGNKTTKKITTNYSGGNTTKKTTAKTTTKAPANPIINNMISVPYHYGLWYVGEETDAFKVTVNPKYEINVASSDNTGLQVIKVGDNTADGNMWKLKALKPGKYTITYSKMNGTRLTQHTYTISERKYWPASITGHGDLDGDGKITTEDASIALKASSRFVTLSDAQKAVGDMNGDGKYTSADARLILIMSDMCEDFDGDGEITENDYKIKVRTSEFYGDVNQDKMIDKRDADILLKASSKTIALSETQQKYADINGDGKVNSKDARIAQRFAAYFSKADITLPVLWTGNRASLKVGNKTPRFKISISDGSDVTLVSSDNSGLQVMRHGDNTASGNSWSLVAKKKGTYRITAQSKTSNVHVTFTYIVK